MIKQIVHNGVVMAIIVSHEHKTSGVEFFTPDSFSQQLALMSHPKGKVIEAHTHNQVQREVMLTNEVLVIRKGRLRVDFYDDDRYFLESHVLEPNDVILLAHGGHGFEVLEDCEMIEVKQGPFLGEQDKTRFVGVRK